MPLASIAEAKGKNGGSETEFGLGGVGLGVIAPNGVWAEASGTEFYAGVSDLSVLAGYAIAYDLRPKTWDFSVPLFAGYTLLNEVPWSPGADPGDATFEASQNVHMVTIGTRAVWSYTTITGRATLELALGVSLSRMFTRTPKDYPLSPTESWVKTSFLLGIGF